jgi:predicted acylesterase/phospholipase RssA
MEMAGSRVSEGDSTSPLEPRREVRLALVLYGGVAMAIYMYGVCFEIWRAVRASRADPVIDPDNPWRKLLDALGREVVVDVISGASAGGINGILLGRALASGADLGLARDVWLDKADLVELLAREDRSPASLLQSRRFEQELQGALQRMSAERTIELADVLDVFVSTTHLDGDARLFTDSLGHVVATNRHDVPVRLAYRNPARYAELLQVPTEESPGKPPRNEFDDDELLIQLARATSAFPVAFEPVSRKPAGEGKGDWPPGDYTDGGVTDNRPFEQVVETIFARAAERPVGRWVLSVNPDPEDPVRSSGAEPDFVDVAAAATFRIPRYESIQRDLDRLEDHRSKVELFWRGAFDGLEGAISRGVDSGVSDAQYGGLRRAALVHLLASEYARATRDLPGDRPRTSPLEDRLAISNLLPGDETDCRPLDVAFELRRTYYVLKLLGHELSEDPADALARSRLAARRELWRRFELLRGETRKAVAELVRTGGTAIDASRLEYARAEAAAELPALAPLERARDAHGRFEERDRALLAVDPFELRVQRDEVEFAQIDPGAAAAIDGLVDADQRLAGEVLGHFGGFLERRWRENDILWGRLDAAAVLVAAIAKDAGHDHRELLADLQESIVRETFVLEDGEDWREHLAAKALGGEGVPDVPGERLSALALGAGLVGERMFGSLSGENRSVGARLVRRALRPLGVGVLRVLAPLLFLLGRAVGRGRLRVRITAALALAPAVAAVGFALFETLFHGFRDFAIFAAGIALSWVLGRLQARRGSQADSPRIS